MGDLATVEKKSDEKVNATMFPVSGIAVAVCSMQFATASESEYASDLPVSNDWDPGLSTKMPLEPFERFTALNRSWISYISKESSNPMRSCLGSFHGTGSGSIKL